MMCHAQVVQGTPLQDWLRDLEACLRFTLRASTARCLMACGNMLVRLPCPAPLFLFEGC
jgi:hypothetical protein